MNLENRNDTTIISVFLYPTQELKLIRIFASAKERQHTNTSEIAS
jgi:hypothetical protein